MNKTGSKCKTEKNLFKFWFQNKETEQRMSACKDCLKLTTSWYRNKNVDVVAHILSFTNKVD